MIKDKDNDLCDRLVDLISLNEDKSQAFADLFQKFNTESKLNVDEDTFQELLWNFEMSHWKKEAMNWEAKANSLQHRLTRATDFIQNVVEKDIDRVDKDLRQRLDNESHLGQWGPDKKWIHGEAKKKLELEREKLEERKQELETAKSQLRPSKMLETDKIMVELEKVESELANLDKKQEELQIEINVRQRDLTRVDHENSSALLQNKKTKVSDILFLLLSTNQLSSLNVYQSNFLCSA